jgi:hypothetical protein
MQKMVPGKYLKIAYFREIFFVLLAVTQSKMPI